MQTVIKFINKNKILVILSICLVLIILATIFRFLTPKKVPNEAVLPDKTKQVTNYLFKYSKIKIPNTLTIFQATQPLSASQIAGQLVNDLALQPAKEVPDYWVGSLETNMPYLALEPDNSITYSENQRRTNTQISQVYNEGEFTELAKKFIAKLTLFPQDEFILVGPFFVALGDGNYSRVATIDDANIIEYDVQKQLNGIPFVDTNKSFPPARIRIDSEKELAKVDFYPVPTQFTDAGSIATLGWNQIENIVKNGSYTIVSFYPYALTTREIDPNQLSTVTFNSATIEYRSNEKNNLVIPYARLTGTATDDENGEFFIEVITPAVPVAEN